MANSYNTYVANGTQTAFLVTFEQRVFTQIQVYVNSELQTGGYTYNSVTKQIVFTYPPTAGAIIRLQRYTDETLLNKFGQDAAFTGQNLDENFEQILFKAEETQEAWQAPLDRALRIPNSEVSISALPTVAFRKNKALGFDSNGQPLMIPLVDIPDSALAIALAMPDGGKWIGSKAGGTFLDTQDTVHISEFLNNTSYGTVSAAVQACFNYAAANGKAVDARGTTITLTGDVTANGITIVGGTWGGTSDLFLVDTTFQDFNVTNVRTRPHGGKVRYLNGEFSGKPLQNKVAGIVIQNQPVDGTIEVDGCYFHDGWFGILHQGGSAGKMTSGIYRNLTFKNMEGDGIELNVVNSQYANGCVIENIYLDNIDGTNAPINNSNWGIGIGIAGNGPYSWTAPDSQYASNITVRNVYARRCRQVVHFEVARNCSVYNVHAAPDTTVSTGTGLSAASVQLYGCKDILIDGVYGEPEVGSTGIDPATVRVVSCMWGASASLGYTNPSFNITIRNVTTKTGRVYLGVAASDVYDNTYIVENVECNYMFVRGVATYLRLANIKCKTFDGIGWYDAGEGDGGGAYLRHAKSVLEMINVTALDDNMQANGAFSRCQYSDVFLSNVNFSVAPHARITGWLGYELTPVGNQYVLIPSAYNDGTVFPTGKEFVAGQVLIKSNGGMFIITSSGSYIPQSDPDFQIRATTVGSKTLTQVLSPNGTSATTPWLTDKPISPGTRIRIPGAGADGADLHTVVVRGPYQVENLWTNPVNIDIKDPIVTATPAGVQIQADVAVAYLDV